MDSASQPSKNVDLITIGDKRYYLVGTAHISKQSVELAEQVIREQRPDSVAVELCESRYKSLKDPEAWKNTDIYTVVRSGRAYVLLAQLMLAAFQKKLGNQLGIKPGAEMMHSLKVAEEIGVTTVLADREVRVTLKRVWSALGFWSMIKLLSTMLNGLFSSQEIKEEEIERLKSSDALEEALREFSDALPEVREALIDERDQYLAAKIRNSPGQSVVAIVGAGHVPGIKRWIHEQIELAPLEELPPGRLSSKIIAWMVPVVIIAMIVYGFVQSGSNTSYQMIEAWFKINAIAGGVGAALALSHPVTVIVAALVSPFTSLNPFIAAGWVAGLVEALLRKPRVSDFDNISEELVTVRGFWNNRISHILLVVILTNLCGTIGTIVGIKGVANFL